MTIREALVTLFLIAPLASHGDTIFVNQAAGGADDGTSWVDAFIDLQDALTTASAGDEIWVASGMYMPEPPDGLREISFAIPSGVAVYGGFAGNETLRTQRDPAAHVTTLSGDLDGGGTASLGDSYHVVRMNAVDGFTRLDGFDIRFGYTFFGPLSEQEGAGLRLLSGNPTIANCRFRYCLAERGGAIHVAAGTPRFEWCTFESNIGSDGFGHGGAVNIVGTSSVSIVSCTFNGNEAEGINRHGYGGAIYTDSDTELFVDRCSFGGNVALNRSNQGIEWSRGGAIYCKGDTFISSSTFEGNVSNVGGAIQSLAIPPMTTRLLNCTFRNNDAISTFIGGQQADGAAGTIAGGDELEIIGCVVYGGFSDNYGGAWVGEGGKVAGSIFWNNTDSAGNIGRSNIRANGPVEYCCVENMLVGEPGEDPPDPALFPGSISLDPQFVDPTFGDFHVQLVSPCIDTGDPLFDPGPGETDLDGRPRVLCARVDMGSFEISGDDYNCAFPMDPADLSNLTICLAGPDIDPIVSDCLAYDSDGDGDVDIRAYAHYMNNYAVGDQALDPPASITGNITYDGVLEGTIHITAENADGEPHDASTSISAPGPYTMSVLFAGAYNIVAFLDVDGDGVANESEPFGIYAGNPVVVTTAGQEITGIDLDLQDTQSISGYVRTAAGNGLFNTLLTLTGDASDSTTTNAQGSYSFEGLPSGMYLVTPSRAGWYFYPYDFPVELTGSDVDGIDFEAHFFPGGEVDGEVSGVVSAVDAPNFNLTIDLDGELLTLYVYVDTIYSGTAGSLEEIEVGFSIQAQYYTSANLAAELDTDPPG